MGGFIELNDTLQITTEQGFPADILDLERHRKSPIKLKDVAGKVFEFYGKPRARVYQTAPNRNYLVHNIDGKWIYWGEILILEQTMHWDEENNSCITSGKYRIIKIYDPEYQVQKTKNETDPGKSFFLS